MRLYAGIAAVLATARAAETDAFAGLGVDGPAWGNMTFFLPTIDARLAALGKAMHYNATQQSAQRKGGSSTLSSTFLSGGSMSTHSFFSSSQLASSMTSSSVGGASSSSSQSTTQSSADLSACYQIYADIAAPFPNTSAFAQGASAGRLSRSMLARCIRPLARYHVVHGRLPGLLYPANDTLAVLPTYLRKEKQGGGGGGGSSSSSVAFSSTMLPSSTTAESTTAAGIGGPGEVFSSSSGLMAAIFRAFAATASPSASYSSASYSAMPTGTAGTTPTASLSDYMALVVNATADGTTVHGGGNSRANVVGGYSFVWGQIYIIDAVLVPPMPLNDTLGAMGFDPAVNATGWDDPGADITAVFSESGRNATVSTDGAVFVNGTAGTTALSGTDGSQHTLDSPDGFNATFDGAPLVEADVPLSNGVLHVVE